MLCHCYFLVSGQRIWPAGLQWRNASASITEGFDYDMRGKQVTHNQGEAMAELIIEMIVANPRQQPAGACAPSSIY